MRWITKLGAINHTVIYIASVTKRTPLEEGIERHQLYSVFSVLNHLGLIHSGGSVELWWSKESACLTSTGGDTDISSQQNTWWEALCSFQSINNVSLNGLCYAVICKPGTLRQDSVYKHFFQKATYVLIDAIIQSKSIEKKINTFMPMLLSKTFMTSNDNRKGHLISYHSLKQE